jgi:protein gp37
MTQFKPERLEQPFHWRKPRRVFVCSMGDLFHDSVTNDQIAAIFGVIAACQQHTFMLLTKRPERAMKWFTWLENMSHSPYDHEYETYLEIGAIFRKPLPNLWIGVSVEDQETADDRIPLLFKIPAAKRFVSYEPALSGVNFDKPRFSEGWWLNDISLIISGAETGPHKRPMDLEWARDVRALCKDMGVPFWFKKDSDGNETLDGVTHHPEFWR